MKEFHAVSTGVSLLTNAQKSGIFPPSVRTSDEGFWTEVLENPEKVQALYAFLAKDPRKHSAELNTLYRATEGRDPADIEVYLVGTRTAANELVRRLLERHLLEAGYRIFTPYEIAGYFGEAARFDPTYAKDEFVKGLGEVLDRLIYLGIKKKQEGYRVLFNPTGGFKAHVISCALAGFLTGSEVYYMNEDFQSLVYLPHFFYLPKGKELEVLELLSKESSLSGAKAQKVIRQYPEEIDRLSTYQLLEVDEGTIRIRSLARAFLQGLNRSKG
jgi:putative CRISPR-associated protein (TIGR02619 family)